MHLNRGEKNEINFVKYLNEKSIRYLNPMFQAFIYDLFGNLDDNYIIKCIGNKYPTKADIFIKINGIQKRISIKMGYNNSVHVERISEFIHFLIENKIDVDIINKYLLYHYADGTKNGTGTIRMSSTEYKKLYQKDIDEINKAFNNDFLIKKAINRFVLQGRNSKYEIHAIIYGTINDFLWIKREEIYNIILSKRNEYSTGVHFGPLFCQPQNRCLNYNQLYDTKRFCVQVKWYSLFDNIIEVMNNKYAYSPSQADFVSNEKELSNN